MYIGNSWAYTHVFYWLKSGFSFCKQTCTKFLSDIFCFAQTLATNIIPLIIHFWLHQPHSRRFVRVEKFIRKVCERHATWLILPDWLYSSFFLLLLYDDQRGTSFVVHKTAKFILVFFCTCKKDGSLEGYLYLVVWRAFLWRISSLSRHKGS